MNLVDTFSFLKSFIEVEVIYKVIIPALQQRDSALHMHTSIVLCSYRRISGRVLCAKQQVPLGQSLHLPPRACAIPDPPVPPSQRRPYSYWVIYFLIHGLHLIFTFALTT